MWDAWRLLWSLLIGFFRSRASLEAENLVLRQQIIVLRRTAPKRLSFNGLDRSIFVGLYRLFPDLRDALAVVRPETVIRWHRAGFRAYWRWRSRPRRGRPTVPLEVRQLIREMSLANPLWGAPRIHGELLKLGIDIGQTSVAKYMARRRGPPSQGWRTFLRNHADGIAALICSWCRRFRSDFSMVCCFCGMTDVGFCGWGPPRIQPQNGSPGSLLRPVDGTRLRAISCATAIDPMVRYSSDVFAPWGSEIDPHPRGRRGRTHMRSG
jgi:hypothetical protein